MTYPCLTLYVPYYRPRAEQRWVEVQAALARNLAAGLFRRVRLLVDTAVPGSPVLGDPRVGIVPLGRRPTYADCFRHAATAVHPGDWVVMANSDIVFDDTLNLLHMICAQERPPFFCLTRHTFSHEGRWEADPGADGCQDAWAWRGPLPEQLMAAAERSDGGRGLRFGVWGSENRLAYEAHAAGMMVVNPGLAVVARHCHWADERPLGGRDYQVRGKYLFPLPGRLGDPVRARVGYCHGPGGLEQLTTAELALRPDDCACERCKEAAP